VTIKQHNHSWGQNLINCVYQLTSSGNINLKYEELNFENKVIVKPRYMSICHADQRYYRGKRPQNILKKKLPMALIHECCGVVLKDYSSTFETGTSVVMIPNVISKISQNGIFENYQEGSSFLSSGVDGFMKELVVLDSNRLVPFESKNEHVFAITELLSVAVHAVKRFTSNSHETFEKIAIFGDGSVGFLTSLALKTIIPSSKIFVIGRHEEKLARFSFVDETFINLPDIKFDHAFECTGGSGSTDAIDKIINHIRPQGTTILMGVSEEKIQINVRDILEKGLIFIGSSRSGYEDFKLATEFLENDSFNKRVSNIISIGSKVDSINSIHKTFENVLNVPFKLIFEWNL